MADELSLGLRELMALSPLLLVLMVALAVLLVESFSTSTSRRYALPLITVGLVAAFLAALYAPVTDHPLLVPWLRFDAFGRFFWAFFIAISLASALLAAPIFRHAELTCGEYYFFLLTSLFGLMLIAGAADFLILFLGIETLSIPLYLLCSYRKRWMLSHEAAIKYFLMGSLAAGFLLYGIALLYGASGSTSFEALAERLAILHGGASFYLLMGGVAFIILGLGFKAAIVPFHTWAPDVYAGAPTPVTAFMAVGTKVGAFSALGVLFFVALSELNPLASQLLAFLSLITLFYANFVAIQQGELRRFFAYSGISHAGFLLIPLAVGTEAALEPFLFYLIVYAIATLAAFAVLSQLDSSQGLFSDDLHGLFSRSLLLALTFSFALLTLSGLPPMIGFFAKFYILKVAFQEGHYVLVLAALVASLLAAFYYLRLLAAMFARGEAQGTLVRSPPALLVAFITSLALLVGSFYPNALLYFLNF